MADARALPRLSGPIVDDSARRDCPHVAACDGTRIVRHPELFALTIAHIDCDAFYASVEKRDRPELAASR